MWDWLLTSIDPERGHHIQGFLSWHARFMVLAWGILLPLGVLIARYFKVLPGQDWPNELDSKFWWQSHLTLQISGGILMVAGLFLALVAEGGDPGAWLHRLLGWMVIGFASAQFLSGWLRGSKGGPTDPAPDGSLSGDHYDMTPRRLLFESVHKRLGYALLLIAGAAILLGLRTANAPNWMWVTLSVYWSCLMVLALLLQKKGRAVDTYQAIWGPDRRHPGNRRKSASIDLHDA